MSGALELATDRFDGPEGAVPLIVLHGLYGSRRNWAALAKRWAQQRPVICVDLRNHGESPWADRMDYAVMAADILALIEAQTTGRAALLGHSLGGKVAMAAALSAPERIERLGVADIAPTAYQIGGFEPLDAMQALRPERFNKRSEAEAALAETITDPATRRFLLSNLVRRDEGGFRWQLNLDAIAANRATLLAFPRFETDRYDGPTLFLAGERSDYIAARHWPDIEARFPLARQQVIPGAGHWIHADKPSETMHVLSAFLS